MWSVKEIVEELSHISVLCCPHRAASCTHEALVGTCGQYQRADESESREFRPKGGH